MYHPPPSVAGLVLGGAGGCTRYNPQLQMVVEWGEPVLAGGRPHWQPYPRPHTHQAPTSQSVSVYRRPSTPTAVVPAVPHRRRRLLWWVGGWWWALYRDLANLYACLCLLQICSYSRVGHRLWHAYAVCSVGIEVGSAAQCSVLFVATNTNW
jgi:hypothetical protein